ncbi:MAG TPA: hypothetical protein VIV58_01635 [Kofleriaceae bacterium]
MKTLIACVLFSLTACSHDSQAVQQPAQPTMTEANAGTPGAEDAVDPTLPSWAPRSCKAYHAAVIHLAGCTQVAQDVRDKVSAKYDADNKAWHDMQNATQADLDQVKLSCGDEAASVKAQLTSDCANGLAEQPVAATK